MTADSAEPPQRHAIHHRNASVEHLGFWHGAVALQRKRVNEPWPDGDDRGDVERRQIDLALLLSAVWRLKLAGDFATSGLTVGSAEAQRAHGHRSRFLSAFPDLEQLRHAVEHFPEWLVGEGRTQPPRSDGERPYRSRFGWTVSRENEVRSCTLSIDGIEVDLLAAATAALRMAEGINDVLNDAPIPGA